MDSAYWGSMRWGYFRWSSYRHDWDKFLAVLESLGAINGDMTHRRLVLGSQDSITGLYEKSYTSRTIKGIIVSRSSSRIASAAGSYVRTDALLFTADGVEEADQILDSFGRYWEVKGKRPIVLGDSFSHREVDLTYVRLQSLSYVNVTPNVEDARSRTKIYWDTYINSSNLNNHPHITCYAEADYPFSRIFLDKNIHIIFAIDPPKSTPKLGHDQYPFGYDEIITTHILTLDTELNHLAEAELRNILENYPFGSQRAMRSRDTKIYDLGSTRLYDTPFEMHYQRGLT